MALYELECLSIREKISIRNYADLVIVDDKLNIAGLRFGGYPEQVMAMSTAISAGCRVFCGGLNFKEAISSEKYRNFSVKTSYDGIYAECVMFLKDSNERIFSFGDNTTEDDDCDDDMPQKKNDENPPRNSYLYCRSNSRDELFAELDRKLSVPLIADFRDYLIDALLERNLLKQLAVYSQSLPIIAYQLTVKEDESDVADILNGGLKSGKIKIPGEFKGKDVFGNINGFTDYLNQFGQMIAERIKKSFVPLYDPEKEKICEKLNEVNLYVKEKAGYELFNAQLAAAEGLKRKLDANKLAFIVAECGSGKTKIGAAALFAHQKKKSFNAVICPSHVADKWVRELHESIPNCYARVIKTFSDIDKMYAIFKSGNETVYCVMSKERARDGYMKEPAVIWSKQKKAFVCPDCGAVQTMPYFEDGISYRVNVDCFFYLRETNQNHKCPNCGSVLWSAVNPDRLSSGKYAVKSDSSWVKISDYGYVFRAFVSKYINSLLPKKYLEEIEQLAKNPDMVIPVKGAYRRYPLSLYFKKHVKQLDGLIIDELHEYSGDSGQGQAMADLAKAAKKVIAMTATLINGYSKGMFYLLFRLTPALMRLDGQSYRKSTSFCRQYGVMEQVITLQAMGINAMSRGQRSSTREKFLPGVSPLVYTRFLLDNTVFLSLTDMGKELPDYEEIPVPLDCPKDVMAEYSRLQKTLVEIIRGDKRLAQKLMSAYLNLLTAYPDQPYGHDLIINPLNKEEILVEPKSIGSIESVLPKDEAIVSLAEQKVKDGERVIIYTAWTRLDSAEKLTRLLSDKKLKVKVLDVSVPAQKREAWGEKQVQLGIDVIITNPTIVATGLDLNAFTTLVFYNIAFNLYVFRQSSRRSWRINQTAPKVEVYLYYYKNTLQHKALKLMASKLSAASIIEGGISDEGIAALSECEDMTSRLAKELTAGIKDSVEDLSAAFKKMAIKKETPTETLKISAKKETAEKPKLIVNKNYQSEALESNTVQYTLFDLLAG